MEHSHIYMYDNFAISHLFIIHKNISHIYTKKNVRILLLHEYILNKDITCTEKKNTTLRTL